ncbi:MAG: hypothetical protein M3Q87_01460 [Actinomycetota bacterium]|nr:hypothetical protein [Actinomycetota bacterium]
MAEPPVAVVDPFDLPEWVGLNECTWTTTDSVGRARVDGVLTDGVSAGPATVKLSVLAADVAYPAAVVGGRLRHDIHQAWVHGEVLLLSDGGYILAVPGTELDVAALCEAIRRFARAVGATPTSFTIALQL